MCFAMDHTAYQYGNEHYVNQDARIVNFTFVFASSFVVVVQHILRYPWLSCIETVCNGFGDQMAVGRVDMQLIVDSFEVLIQNQIKFIFIR